MNSIKISLISFLVLSSGAMLNPVAAQRSYDEVRVGPKGVRYVIRGSHGAPHILPYKFRETVGTSLNQSTSVMTETPQMELLDLETRPLPQLERGNASMVTRVASGQGLIRSPRFIRAASSNHGTRIPEATYHFTVKVPENAAQSLKAIKIESLPNQETVSFKTNQIRAFRGDSFAGGPTLSLASIGGPSPEGEELIVFDPPISPGNTVTVALRGATPDLGGSYLFGVTAFPTGESEGQFLGYRRIDFHAD